MTIKKVKKIKNLKKNDIVILNVSDQNDAGIFSDRTENNAIVVVDTVTIVDNYANVLTNGGYEFIYDKNLIVFQLGTYGDMKMMADALYDTFQDTPATVKGINYFIKELKSFKKLQK